MNRIRQMLGWFTEEHRRGLYVVVVALMPLLAAYNIVQSEHVALWTTLAQAILGLTAGVIATANAQARWRAWLYAVAVGVNGLLLAFGVLSPDQAPLVLAVAAAVLSIGGGGLSLAFYTPTNDKEAQR